MDGVGGPGVGVVAVGELLAQAAQLHVAHLVRKAEVNQDALPLFHGLSAVWECGVGCEICAGGCFSQV